MEALILLAFVAVVVGIIAAAVSSQAGARRAEEEARAKRQAEEQRLKECGEVVLFFANHLGYIARQVVTRRELGRLIDEGCSPEQLGREIAKRIEDIDGLILGYHSIGETRIDVKLTQEFRDRHVYVIGKSGSGKTNLLRTLILQDLHEGEGLGVIAPESEMLTEEILPYIPDHRIDDVIYINPSDTDCPVAFNPLHLDEGEDIDLKVDENLTIFQRVVGDAGPRMEEILRQALYALIERPGSTLLDIGRLLERGDAGMRNEICRTTKSEELAHWWRDVYPTFPKDSHLPITNRLGKFLHAKAVRALLCTPAQSLNFGQCMDAGRVMLFNLSDGILGEQNSQILGQLVVAKFQLAVMSRARQSKSERRPFYLYVDEFQSFVGIAGASYEKILSRARKYRLSLTLAHQQTGQLPASLLKEIMGNVSTTVCFLVSREDAMRFSRELVTTYDGEVMTIPEQDILQLRVGQAFCKIGQHSFKMNTYLADGRPSSRRANYIIDRCRLNYASPVAARVVAAPSSSPSSPTPGLPRTPDDPLASLDPSNVFD